MVARSLSQEFIDALNNGILKELLRYVKTHKDIILEIRKNYINLYYRGGNLFKIKAVQIRGKVQGGYRFEWDLKYTCGKPLVFSPDILGTAILSKSRKNRLDIMVSDQESCRSCIRIIPELKRCMKEYFREHPKTEKFIQQAIVEKNTLSNYLLTDFEYQKGATARFDLMGIKKGSEYSTLSFIELKQGYKSLETKVTSKGGFTSGLKKHLADIVVAISTDEKNNALAREDVSKSIETEIIQARELFLQKKKLGSYVDQEFPENIRNNEIEVLFVIADYQKPQSYKPSILLEREVKNIREFLRTEKLLFDLVINFIFLKTKEAYPQESQSQVVGLDECLAEMRSFY